MAVSDGFLEFVVDQLDACGPITWKRMFGGVGVYADGIFFAVLDNDALFLKVNESNRADFVRAGSTPFRPYADGRESIHYYSVPASVLENAEELESWARKAIAVAVASAATKRTRRRS